MSRNSILLLGIFLLALTLHRNSVSSFSVDGSSIMLPARLSGASTMLSRGPVCHRRLGGRQRVGQATSALVRRMTTVMPSATTLVDSGSSSRAEIAMSSLPGSLKTWFDLSLPEGRCIGVGTTDETDSFPPERCTSAPSDHWLFSAFHRDEVEFGMQLKKTRNSFWLGRLALRRALNFPDYPILKDEYGRPEMKNDFLGSISHKQDKGVAIVSPPTCIGGAILSGIGIDLELTSRPGKPSLVRRILTSKERESLGQLPGISLEEEVLLRFSLKEAIYKAAHPLLNQYVGFQEAEVTPHPDGTASCKWLLDNQADQKIALLTAHWKKLEDEEYFLTSASVYTKSD